MDEQVLTTAYAQCALGNRATFDAVLEAYVRQKLAYYLKRLGQGEREVWFDATDCVWCVFDDPAFERHGDVREQLRALGEAAGGPSADANATDGLQIYWSLGDIVMPVECDTVWVAHRIAEEVVRQLEGQGYRCLLVERAVEDETRVGVLVRRAALPQMLLSELLRRLRGTKKEPTH